MRIVAISDVHGKLDQVKLPPANLLLIAGDLTMMGTDTQLIMFNEHIGRIKHLYEHVVCIAGNHDWGFFDDHYYAKSLIPNVSHYLEDELVDIDGVKIYGSPHQPEYGGWAFNLQRGPEIKAKWDLIPPCDILITHGPAYGVLDRVPIDGHVGCKDLLDAIKRIKPRLHVAGHIHIGYGIQAGGHTTFINASACNEKYQPVNPPIVVELDDNTHEVVDVYKHQAQIED